VRPALRALDEFEWLPKKKTGLIDCGLLAHSGSMSHIPVMANRLIAEQNSALGVESAGSGYAKNVRNFAIGSIVKGLDKSSLSVARGMLIRPNALFCYSRHSWRAFPQELDSVLVFNVE
jgi:hypothetical protein